MWLWLWLCVCMAVCVLGAVCVGCNLMGRASARLLSAGMALDKSGSRIDSDGVKLFCARMAKNVADRAMQVRTGVCLVGSLA